MKDPIVGIDLGTSNSVVAFADEVGVVRVLADDGGYKIHPSVVSFHPNGGVVVGTGAKQRKVIDPQNTIYSVKRLIGRSYRSPEVQTAKTRVPYQIKEGANQLPMISTRGGEFAVPEISAIVLDHMRNIASARLDAPVSRAVVTVPAAFNDAQRSATATAGAIAGLTVVRVLNEPTAAALAYGHARNLQNIIAVYDFGGGTFDISLLRLNDQVYEVLGTSGDTFLGGDDLDERLVDKMVSKFLAENRIDLRTNEVAMMRLRAVAEQTKIELSRRSRAVVRIDEIAYGAKGAALNLSIEITRDEFVSQVADIIDRTFPVCQEALSIAGLGTDQIADIVLVGGTTKIPYVRDQVSKFFNRAPRTDVNPEDAVAIGASLQAQSLQSILSRPRKSSRQVPIVRPESESFTDSDTSTSSFTDVNVEAADDAPSGSVTMAPTDELTTGRPKRTTAGYSEVARRADLVKPDTSYSVTRTGTRDSVDVSRTKTGNIVSPNDQKTRQAPNPLLPQEEKTRPSVENPYETGEATKPSVPNPLTETTKPGVADPFDTRTPQPLGRLKTGAVPTIDPKRTAFGVPPGPVAPPPIPGKPSTSRIPAQPRPPASPPARSLSELAEPIKPTTNPGVGTSSTTLPTMPAMPAPKPMKPTLSPPEDDDWLEMRPEPATAPALPQMPTAPPPKPATTTQPMSPVQPIAGPTAPTLVALAPDFAVEVDTANAASAASTARGMGPVNTQALATTQYAEPPREAPLPAYGVVPVILEVTPRGLGIGTVAGFCEELIRRNSRVPTEMKRIFTTSRDRQNHVRIVICQGESRRLDNNTVIGDLLLQNLPPRPRGETAIEVTFMLDASGILQVSARDTLTNTEQRASLDLVGGVPQQDVAASRDRIQQLRR